MLDRYREGARRDLPHGRRRRRRGDGRRSDGRRDRRDVERRLGGLVRQLLDSPQGELRKRSKGRGLVNVLGPSVRTEDSMNDLRGEEDEKKFALSASLHAHRRLVDEAQTRDQHEQSEAATALRKAWRRSWIGGVAWPWCRREAEIVGKVAGVVTLSLWLKRLIEQFLELEDPERVDPPGRDERRRPRRRAGSRSREDPPWPAQEIDPSE